MPKVQVKLAYLSKDRRLRRIESTYRGSTATLVSETATLDGARSTIRGETCERKRESSAIVQNDANCLTYVRRTTRRDVIREIILSKFTWRGTTRPREK